MLLVLVAVVVISLYFFCRKDNDEYGNNSTSSHLLTTILRLGCYISRHHPIHILEASDVTTTKTINGNGAHHANLT